MTAANPASSARSPRRRATRTVSTPISLSIRTLFVREKHVAGDGWGDPRDAREALTARASYAGPDRHLRLF